jgi:peptidoglycan/xylan/chitin deacetylase (PgdA/CDA1 family)
MAMSKLNHLRFGGGHPDLSGHPCSSRKLAGDKPLSLKIITTSWDDGHPLDLKLAELLEKYDIPATFYIPIDNRKGEYIHPQQIKEIAQIFDIGGHTYHHVDLTKVPLKEAEREIVEGKRRLEEITGKEVLSFCYPCGRFNDEIINIVRRAGFIGARTTKSATRSIKDPFKMSTTAYAASWCFGLIPYIRHSVTSKDFGLFRFVLKNNLLLNTWDKIAIKTLDFVVNNGGVWHLWGHSWEVDDHNDWERLERVFCKVGALSKEVIKMDNSQWLKMCTEKR